MGIDDTPGNSNNKNRKLLNIQKTQLTRFNSVSSENYVKVLEDNVRFKQEIKNLQHRLGQEKLATQQEAELKKQAELEVEKLTKIVQEVHNKWV